MLSRNRYEMLKKKIMRIKNRILHPHTDRIEAETFEQAFNDARKQGKRTFIWSGDEKFYTALSSETPQKQLELYGITNEQLHNRRWWQERLAENLYPFGYANPVERFIDAVVFDIMDSGRMPMSFSIALEDKQRMDFFNTYNGLPQKNGSLSISDWKPLKGGRYTPYYYRDNRLTEVIIELLPEILKGYEQKTNIQISHLSKSSTPPVLEGQAFLQAVFDEHHKTFYPYYGDNLGAFDLGIGQDEKGYFLYYYDKWDFEVLSGVIDLEGIKPEYTYDKDGHITARKYKEWHGIKITEKRYQKMEKIKDMLHNIKTDFGKPFEVYDRIYFDKKTLQPLKVKAPRQEIKQAMKNKSQKTQEEITQNKRVTQKRKKQTSLKGKRMRCSCLSERS